MDWNDWFLWADHSYFWRIEHIIKKLQKCGFIKFSNGEFILLTEIENLFPKSFNIRNYEKIYNKLAKKKCIEVMDSRFVLSEAEYTEAVNKYRKKAKSSYI